MKLLLDENLPKRLKQDFPEHKVYTVRDRGWNGKKNGELLELMKQDGFDVLITFGRNLQYQQNFIKFSLPVFVLNAQDNSYGTLKEFVTSIKQLLGSELKSGPTEVSK